MTITFPLSWPAGAGGVGPVTLRPNVVVQESRSPFTGVGQHFAWPAEWWEAEITLPPMERERADIWIAWLTALRGKAGTFLFGPKYEAQPKGVASGAPLVKGAGQLGAVLALDGATPSVAGWLKAGDYIQLGSGAAARLHRVLADAASDVAGNVTLDIWPAIVTAPADNSVVVVSGPQGLFRLAGNANGHSTDTARLYGLTIAIRSEA